MLPTMFPMGSGTTASTSTEPEHIDIEPCSSGPASGRTETSRQRCKRASLTLSKTTRYPDIDLTPALYIEPRDSSKRRSTPGSPTIGEECRAPHGQREDVPRAAGHRRRQREHARRDADDRPHESVARHAHQRLRRPVLRADRRLETDQHEQTIQRYYILQNIDNRNS